jgi:hypothetical protein
MADSKKNAKNAGVSTGTVLFLIFLVLKLTGNIEWSWWWVTAPIWGPILFGIIWLLILWAVAKALE